MLHSYPFQDPQICHINRHEKAFLNVTLYENYRDYTRFFWLKNVTDPKGPFDTYRFKKVLFGVVSSTFILSSTLSHHLHQHNTPISCDILDNLYVDNVLSGCSSEKELIHYYHSARRFLSEAHFKLESWVTSSPQLRIITQQEKTADTANPNNMLGILWNPVSEHLSLTSRHFAHHQERAVTRVLQDIWSPLNSCSSYYLSQTSYTEDLALQIEWDVPLGEEFAKEWQQIADDLCQLHQFSIHRKYFTEFGTSCMTLHTF